MLARPLPAAVHSGKAAHAQSLTFGPVAVSVPLSSRHTARLSVRLSVTGGRPSVSSVTAAPPLLHTGKNHQTNDVIQSRFTDIAPNNNSRLNALYPVGQ